MVDGHTLGIGAALCEPNTRVYTGPILAFLSYGAIIAEVTTLFTLSCRLLGTLPADLTKGTVRV